MKERKIHKCTSKTLKKNPQNNSFFFSKRATYDKDIIKYFFGKLSLNYYFKNLDGTILMFLNRTPALINIEFLVEWDKSILMKSIQFYFINSNQIPNLAR